jgi:hypothetical protein
VAFFERNLSSGEASFVSTWTYHSTEDSLEAILAPGYVPEKRVEFELRDVIRLVDKDFRACHAIVCGFTDKGSPVFKPFVSAAEYAAAFPETQPAEAGAGRRRAA